MLNDTPTWVTVIVGIGIVLAIIGGLIVGAIIAGNIIGRRLRQSNAILSGVIVGQVLQQMAAGDEQRLVNLRKAYEESFVMVETVKAFELDESIPLKLRKIGIVLRTAQLKHRYETATQALIYAQGQLLEARKKCARLGEHYRGDVKTLEAFVADQEQKLVEIEGLLDKYDIAFRRATSQLELVK